MARFISTVGCAGLIAATLSACGASQPSVAALDACNIFSSRDSANLSGTDRVDAIDAMAESLETADEQSLKDAYNVLTTSLNGDAVQWRQVADDFMKTCTDLGWELPEG